MVNDELSKSLFSAECKSTDQTKGNVSDVAMGCEFSRKD